MFRRRVENITIVLTLSVTCALCFIGCSKVDRNAERQIARAEAIIETLPDSALRELERVDTVGLSDEILTRYCLVICMARHKCYMNLKDLSLISKTVKYFKGQDNLEEIQSLYFYAWALSENNQDKDSFAIYHMAYDKAKEQENFYYWGMCARALSEMYGNRFKYEKQLKLALESKYALYEYERQVGNDDRKLSAWSDIMLSQAYLNLKEPEKAIDVCKNVDEEIWKGDSVFRYRILENIARSLHLQKKYKEAVGYYRIIQAEGLGMDGDDWCGLCQNLFNAGYREEASAVLDTARMYISNAQDSLYYQMLESYILDYKGNSIAAFASARRYEKSLGDRSDSLLEHSDLADISAVYKDIADYNVRMVFFEKKKNRILIIGSVVVLTVLCIYWNRIFYYYKRRLILRNIDLQNILFNSEKLERELNELKSQYADLIDSFESKNGEISSPKKNNKYCNTDDRAIDKKKLLKCIKGELKSLDELCYILYNSPEHLNSDENMSERLRLQQEWVRSEQSLDFYDVLIDVYSDGWMDKIKEIFPEFKKSRLRLIRYLYSGFCSETIAYLTNRSSKELVNTAKSKLKISLLKNSNNIDIKEIFQKLHIKN